MTRSLPSMSGYSAEFITPLLKRHECPVCLHAMRDPVQTECGHLFCKGCLEPVLEGPNPVCPIDKISISRNEVMLIVYGLTINYINV